MRILSIRIVLFLGLAAAANVLISAASAKNGPVGNWTGVVSQKDRNIVVTLSVKSLQVGSVGGDMRWGSPRACSLQTEYSGMREAQYAFNIAGTNGGWCDSYRDGSLLLEMGETEPQSLTFRLANKQGGGRVEGQLTNEP
jgi:hypothetical protein